MTAQKQYEAYRNELKKLNDQKDAWYTIASQKYSEGDRSGQTAAYTEIDAIQAKINALVEAEERRTALPAMTDKRIEDYLG